MKLQNCFPLDTDAYKIGHHLLNRKDLVNGSAYYENRKGALYPATSYIGMQMLLMDDFDGEVVTKEMIEYGKDRVGSYLGSTKQFNEAMWQHIVNKYGGRLPLRIRSVKEGTLVPINNVLFTIETTDPLCAPLRQHAETLLMHNWYPNTVSTNMFFAKLDTLKHLKISGTPESINYKWADFGFRACSCKEQAARGSIAHLAHFRTSDTLIGDRAAAFYYGYKADSILKSVLASEHAVALQYGGGEGEYTYVHACLDAAEAINADIVSIVIDTYDSHNFIDHVITRKDIKDRVLAFKGKVVWRQDSGDPQEETLRNLNSLSISYGYADNNKGYKQLNPKIGILQGDGMQRSTVDALYTHIEKYKWSSDNLLPGSGSGTLVKGFERDTQRVAIKPSVMQFGDVEQNVCKEVKSQPDKKSKAGHLKLHKSGEFWSTISSADMPRGQYNGYKDELETVFENGELTNKQTFDDIMERAEKALHEEDCKQQPKQEYA